MLPPRRVSMSSPKPFSIIKATKSESQSIRRSCALSHVNRSLILYQTRLVVGLKYLRIGDTKWPNKVALELSKIQNI